MKSEKGFSLIELLITIVIIGTAGSFVIPQFFKFIEDEKIAKKAGSFVLEFKQEASKTDEVILEKIETTTVTDLVLSNVECFEGKKIIRINGEIYHIGKIDSWEDIKSIDCNAGG